MPGADPAKRLAGVGTQIVHDQMDGLRRRIAVGDGLNEVGKFRRRPGRGHLRKVNSGLRFDAAEYIRGSTNVRIHCRVWPRWRVSWTGVLGHRCEESPAFHPRTPPASGS